MNSSELSAVSEVEWKSQNAEHLFFWLWFLILFSSFFRNIRKGQFLLHCCLHARATRSNCLRSFSLARIWHSERSNKVVNPINRREKCFWTQRIRNTMATTTAKLQWHAHKPDGERVRVRGLCLNCHYPRLDLSIEDIYSVRPLFLFLFQWPYTSFTNNIRCGGKHGLGVGWPICQKVDWICNNGQGQEYVQRPSTTPVKTETLPSIHSVIPFHQTIRLSQNHDEKGETRHWNDFRPGIVSAPTHHDRQKC